MVGGRCEAENQGMTPAGNGACDVRAAANALFFFFHYYCAAEAISMNVCLFRVTQSKGEKIGNNVWNSKMFKIVYVTK